MTNNYIKVTLGYDGDLFFFFDSRVVEEVQAAHAAAAQAALSYKPIAPIPAEKDPPFGGVKAHLSIWRHCGGLPEAIPEVGEWVDPKEVKHPSVLPS